MRVEIYELDMPGHWWSYVLYTSKSCGGLGYSGQYKTLGTCKEAVRRLGVRLGHELKVEVMK